MLDEFAAHLVCFQILADLRRIGDSTELGKKKGCA